MHLSPFFHNLRSAYVAELDDMSHDSDGALVLQQRLAQRRGELEFLVRMLELSPEMVAVVLHKAFIFHTPLAIEQMLGREPEDLPDWEELVKTMTVAPWAQPMVQTLRTQPAGDWFLSVAAACEYMIGMSSASGAKRADDDADDQHDDSDAEGADAGDDPSYLSADDDTRGGDTRTREDAGADWMAEQGFDRKD
jgi:hypothetical protein